MRVTKTYVDYTGILNVGRKAFFIYLGPEGFETNIDELVEKTICFNLIIIKGSDPYNEREELSKFIRKVIKNKPTINFEIHSDGKNIPKGIGNFSQIKYVIFLGLKKTGLQYTQRIIERYVKWFDNMNAFFIFNVENINDLDEVTMLVSDFNIEKDRIFLTDDKGFIEKLISYANRNNYNIAPNFGKILWEKNH